MEQNKFCQKAYELKDRLYEFIIQRKKLAALTNYQHCAPLGAGEYLTILRRIMRETLPGAEESRFMDHLLKKAEIYYLDWAYRTKWLKKEMGKMRRKHKVYTETQMKLFVNYEKKRKVSTAVPTHLLANTSSLSRHVKGGR